jgi:hypothetical protein
VIIEPKTWKSKDAESVKPRFRGLVHYMLSGKGTERCTWYMTGNLEGMERRDDSDGAVRVVEAYQRRNTRATSNKTYHMVISLHPEDRTLSDRELEDVVRRAVAAAGLGEHQYIAARHNDQEHEHVHVAVNKIHPRTLKIHHPWKDIENFKALASQLENELDLHRVDRSPEKQRTAQSYASRQFEMARGVQSFAGWARNRIGEEIDLGTVSGWEELHARLALHGVRMVRRGNGLAVVDASRGNLACKASSLGRQWSKRRLSERFGEFVEGPSAEHVTTVKREAYRSESLRPLREDQLWRDYQEELDAARTRRQGLRDALSSKIDAARAAHRRRFKLRHHAIAAMPVSGTDKRKLYKILSFERRAAERKLALKIKGWRTASVERGPGSWKEFLAARASRGDPKAIRRLGRQLRGPAIKGDEKRGRTLPSRGLHTSRGSIVHNLPGGVRLRESAESIELLGDSREDALKQLVRLAEQRFEGQRVTLLGTERARERLAEMAAERGLEIAQERQR